MTTITIPRTIPIVAPRVVDRAALRARAGLLARNLLAAYCFIGLLGYAPAEDANGQCHCPICDPFSFVGAPAQR